MLPVRRRTPLHANTAAAQPMRVKFPTNLHHDLATLLRLGIELVRPEFPPCVFVKQVDNLSNRLLRTET